MLPEAKILFSCAAAVIGGLALWVIYTSVAVKTHWRISREEVLAMPASPPRTTIEDPASTIDAPPPAA